MDVDGVFMTVHKFTCGLLYRLRVLLVNLVPSSITVLLEK